MDVLASAREQGWDDDTVRNIAQVCHETNRAFCATLGDNSQQPWDDAPSWQRVSAIQGVAFHLTGEHGPEASHNSWMAQKVADGWVFGLEKDADKKTHPCIRPFNTLETEQQMKDVLFRAVVHAFKTHITEQ